MRAKEYLERATLAERRLNTALRKVDLYKSMAEKVTSSIGGEQVSHTRDVTSNESAIVRLIEAREHVEQLQIEYQAIINEIVDTLHCLNDNEAEEILISFYLKHQSFETISSTMHICRSWLYERHNRALQKLSMVLAQNTGQERTETDKIG